MIDSSVSLLGGDYWDIFDDLRHSETIPNWRPELPPRLSASQMTGLERCEEQYRQIYLLKRRARPSGALVWGKADHEAHAVNFRQKVASSEDLKTDEVEDAFATAFDAEIDKAGGFDEVEWKQAPGKTKDIGTRLVALYHREVSPGIAPLAVEQRFELEVPALPVPLVGYVDVIGADSALERKTSHASVRAPKPQWEVQGLVYQAALDRPVDLHISYGYETPKTGKTVLGVNTPADSPGLRINEKNPELVWEYARTAAAKLLALLEAFGPDQPWPGARSHPFACSYCGFKPTCPWWGKKPPDYEFGEVPF